MSLLRDLDTVIHNHKVRRDNLLQQSKMCVERADEIRTTLDQLEKLREEFVKCDPHERDKS